MKPIINTSANLIPESELKNHNKILLKKITFIRNYYVQKSEMK